MGVMKAGAGRIGCHCLVHCGHGCGMAHPPPSGGSVHEDRPKNRHSFAKVLPKAIVPPWRWLIIRPMARDEGDRGRPGIWRAGDIEVDVGQQRVLRGGTPVELPRLSFDMLLALMRAAPNFLTNEELMTRV